MTGLNWGHHTNCLLCIGDYHHRRLQAATPEQDGEA